MLKQYDQEQWTVYMMGMEELIETTKCLLPCTFMEYKVIPSINQNYLYLLSVIIFGFVIDAGWSE